LPAPFHNALVLTGPTASGKTALGIELALRMNAEIVSMDSMAIYRHMDIGTAKPTAAECSEVPHHLVDVLEPWESGSVAWWLDEAKRCVADIEARGKQALFVGGTPLYLKALISGLFDGPPADDELRRRLIAEAETHGSTALHQRLTIVDPLCAARIHPNDVRRMVRALEVFELTGKRMSDWQTQWADSEPGAIASFPAVLCVDLPREQLYSRINQRVEAMFAAGLVDEVRQLRASDKPLSHEAAQALGYKEIFAFLDGKATLAETIVQVQTRSRNFAKRQIAWFRHLPQCRMVAKELTGTLWHTRIQVSAVPSAEQGR
jgi:tRNA dimethylallyltransferase